MLVLFACATVDYGGLEVKFDLTSATACSLEGLDDFHALLIRNFAKNHVLAIKPGCDDRGNEEL